MPHLERMKENLKKLGYPDELIEKIIPATAKSEDPYDIIHAINQLDNLICPQQRLTVMEKEGCCKSGQRDKDCRNFGLLNKGKPLIDKVKGISLIKNMGNPILNDDGTITTGINWFEQGKFKCACPTVKKLKDNTSVPLTYCGCCAGHFLYHYQNMLGVKLRLKEIKSSPLTSHGELPCAFVFEVVYD